MSRQLLNATQVTDSREHPVYKKVDATKGKFAFTSDDYDTFHICFNNILRDGVLSYHCYVGFMT